jgi:hypothetical protein
VRISLVAEKANKIAGEKMGSSTQTTRYYCGDLDAAASGLQLAKLVTEGVAMAEASMSTRGVADPRATFSPTPGQLLSDELGAKPFCLAATSLMLPNALGTRLTDSSLYESMRELAHAEISERAISSRIRQEGHSLRRICNRILNQSVDSSAGDGIWAAMALLSYLSHEPVGRELLRAQHVNDLDAAVADAFLSYGRAEVTRRARLNESQIAAAAAVSVNIAIPELPEPTNAYENALVEAMNSITHEETIHALTNAPMEEEPEEPELGIEVGSTVGSSVGTLVIRPKSRLSQTPAFNGCSRSPFTLSRQPSSGTLAVLEGTGVETKSVLSLKRKRSTIAQSCSIIVLDYWAAALDSSHAHVLLMLISSKLSAACAAAEHTLHSQMTGDGSQSTMLEQVSKKSAIDSAKALRSLVRQDDSPKMITWRAKPASGKTSVHVGIARSLGDLKDTCVMACTTPVSVNGVLPEFDAGLSNGVKRSHVSIAWVSAVHLDPEGSQPAPLPGVVETYRKVASWPSSGPRGDILKNRVMDSLKGCTSPFSVSGVARSVITVDARIVINYSQLDAGKKIAERMAKDLERARDASKDLEEFPLEVATVLGVQPLVDKDAEDQVTPPLSTPSCNLALGMQVNEIVRVIHRGKVHRGDPCRAFFGMELSHGEVSESEMSFADKPSSLLTLIDVKVQPDKHSAPPERVPRRLDAVHLNTPVSLTVAGDSAMRVAECVKLLIQNDKPMQARAVLLASCTTASHLGELTNLAGAGRLNTAAASAKRVLVADNCKRLWLTPYQVFRVGHRGVPVSFPNSAWRGAYPAGIEIGSAGGLGRNATAETADRRQHGKFLVSQTLANEYSLHLAEKTAKQVDDKHYDFIPIQARGIVHHAVPGLHTFLDDMVQGLESVRELASITAMTVDSLQCLPFGPYSDNLAPGVKEDLDPTVGFSNPYDSIDGDGRAYLSDATLQDVSIFCEPLVPRLQILDASDNPFASIHDHIDSFFNAVACIAMSLSVRGKDSTWLFHNLDVFHGHDAMEIDDYETVLALDTMVLLSGAIYPTEFAIGETVVLPAYAKGLAWAVNQTDQQDLESAWDAGIISEHERQQATRYFDAFCRETNSAWPAIAALIDELIVLDGRFNSTIAGIQKLKRLVDGALVNAWRVASEDGQMSPPIGHPLQLADTPSDVTASMLAPVFVDRFESETGEWTDARGAAVGVKPGNFRNLVCTMLAASMPEVTEVQFARNEGGLLLRPSSAVDILTQNNTPRSDKAASPMGIEGDTLAFGTREAKLRSCKRQRQAWEYNLRKLMPLCTTVSKPRSNTWLYRGEQEALEYVSEQTISYRATGIITSEDAVAKAVFAEASGAC